MEFVLILTIIWIIGIIYITKETSWIIGLLYGIYGLVIILLVFHLFSKMFHNSF